MKVKSESYSIDAAEPGFIQLRQSRAADDGDDSGGELWFERGSLAWVVDAGPEQAPVMNP